MTRSLLIIVLTLFFGYGIIEAWPLMSGPHLNILSPVNNDTLSADGITTVTGTASRVSLLSLNGAPLLHDEKGSFSSTLTFPRGGSILTFVATDRFGRRITETRSIFVP